MTLWTRVSSAGIEFTSLMFSSDNGRTWHEECPLLTGTNRSFAVKVEWTGRDNREMTWGGLLSCSISAEKDFASSEGKQWGSPLFWQMHDEKYKPFYAQYLPNAPLPFYFHVDLGSRGDGDRKHPKTKKPMPSCAAYLPGTWRFTCHVGYHLEQPDPKSENEDKRLVEAQRNFFVYLDDPANSVVE